MKKMKYMFLVCLILFLCIFAGSGCSHLQSATQNSKMDSSGSDDTSSENTASDNTTNDNATDDDTSDDDTSSDDTTDDDTTDNANAVIKETSTYDCDIEADKAAFDGIVDITVGDSYYATQINDWYMYFDQYEGQVVEIEGYYIGDFAPYDFIGRYGPTCPCCQGGYVCFEFLTDEDVSQLVSGEDWIKVTGILREGTDSTQGPFYYIEVLSLEKMEQVGQATVSN